MVMRSPRVKGHGSAIRGNALLRSSRRFELVAIIQPLCVAGIRLGDERAQNLDGLRVLPGYAEHRRQQVPVNRVLRIEPQLRDEIITRAILGAPSSSNKRLAWPTMDAFGIRAILPRPKGQGLPRIQINMLYAPVGVGSRTVPIE
jgi:hypothetical protein